MHTKKEMETREREREREERSEEHTSDGRFDVRAERELGSAQAVNAD